MSSEASSNSSKGTIVLLVVSLLCGIPGLLIAHFAGFSHPCLLLKGVALTFGGMFLGAIISAIACNLFLPSERKRLKESRFAQCVPQKMLRRKIRDRSNLLRLKAHPYIAPLFCAAGLLVGIVVVLAGWFGSIPGPNEGPGLEITPKNAGYIIFGIFITGCYVWFLTFCLVKMAKKQWNPYLDTALAKLDAEIKQIEDKLAAEVPTTTKS